MNPLRRIFGPSKSEIVALEQQRMSIEKGLEFIELEREILSRPIETPNPLGWRENRNIYRGAAQAIIAEMEHQ